MLELQEWQGHLAKVQLIAVGIIVSISRWHTLSPSPYFPIEAFIPLGGMITPLTLTVQYRFFPGWICVYIEKGWARPAAKACVKGEAFSAGLKSSFPLLKQGAPTDGRDTGENQGRGEQMAEVLTLPVLQHGEGWGTHSPNTTSKARPKGWPKSPPFPYGKSATPSEGVGHPRLGPVLRHSQGWPHGRLLTTALRSRIA